MLQAGYVKIYRSITNWEWYKDSNTRDVFLHLLFTVNHTDMKWRGHTIKRGQRAVSLDKLSRELYISVRSVRTAIKHLKSTGEVTSEKLPECTLFTISNYEKFQDTTNVLTNERQTSDKRVTNERQQCKNDKNNKNDKNIPPISPMGDCTRRFEIFWEAYPRKVTKERAEKSFAEIDPDEATLSRMLKALEWQKQQPNWQEEGGRYIPYPGNWLKERRWEEELPSIPKSVRPYAGYRRLTPDD